MMFVIVGILFCRRGGIVRWKERGRIFGGGGGGMLVTNIFIHAYKFDLLR